MSFLEQLKKENILIVGFGYRTGLQTANYLLNKEISVSISDLRNKEELKSLISELKGNVKNFFTGNQDISQLKDIDRVILSPGVPRKIPIIQSAIEQKIPVMSEIELAYLLCNPKLVIGITGTDGKTTTTSLCNELIKEEFHVLMGGNIGIPFISFVDDVKDDTIILLELSSYQLEDIPYFNCNIAALLNISEDHLDRYESFNHYIDAKKNIFKNQSSTDYAILNLDDNHYNTVSQGIKSQIMSFSKSNTNANAYVINNKIIFNDNEIISLNNIKLKGVHNLENILASVIIAKLVGVSNKSIQKVINEFRGLPHRNEFIASVCGIDFINDSKATTINSVIKSLLSQDKPIILLMGGQDKGLDFSLLKNHIEQRVKKLILFGEAKEKIDREIQFSPKKTIENLESAFEEALGSAVSGDIILLSPGCTSFDQYSNYEERGNHFRELVFKLKNKDN